MGCASALCPSAPSPLLVLRSLLLDSVPIWGLRVIPIPIDLNIGRGYLEDGSEYLRAVEDFGNLYGAEKHVQIYENLSLDRLFSVERHDLATNRCQRRRHLGPLLPHLAPLHPNLVLS